MTAAAGSRLADAPAPLLIAACAETLQIAEAHLSAPGSEMHHRVTDDANLIEPLGEYAPVYR